MSKTTEYTVMSVMQDMEGIKKHPKLTVPSRIITQDEVKSIRGFVRERTEKQINYEKNNLNIFVKTVKKLICSITKTRDESKKMAIATVLFDSMYSDIGEILLGIEEFRYTFLKKIGIRKRMSK